MWRSLQSRFEQQEQRNPANNTDIDDHRLTHSSSSSKTSQFSDDAHSIKAHMSLIELYGDTCDSHFEAMVIRDTQGTPESLLHRLLVHGGEEGLSAVYARIAVMRPELQIMGASIQQLPGTVQTMCVLVSLSSTQLSPSEAHITSVVVLTFACCFLASLCCAVLDCAYADCW